MGNLATRAIVQSVLFLAVLGAVLLGTAGSFDFPAAWAYLGIFAVATAGVTGYLLARDPALLERRLALAEKGEGSRKQRTLQLLAGMAFFGLMVVAGLDRRLGWSGVPTWLVVAGDVCVVAGFLAVLRVFRENSFTSSIIEVAEKQTVVDTGPYRWVRHPMYAGALPLIFGSPLALASWVAELAAAALVAVIVVRLLDEERFLAANLPGYAAYMQRTRARLIPGIW